MAYFLFQFFFSEHRKLSEARLRVMEGVNF